MKNAIILTLCLTATLSYSQNYDSLQQRILSLERNQRNIQLNLRKAHKEFGTGTAAVVAGAVIVGITHFFIDKHQTEGTDNDQTPYFIIGGSLLVIGTSFQIDSHKHLGRAGRRKK